MSEIITEISRFAALWTRCTELYMALRKRGTLALSGMGTDWETSTDWEISYVDRDDLVALVEGHATPEAACEALLAQLEAEVEERREALRLRYEADLEQLPRASARL